MGQRASNTAGVTFEDVVIPNEVYILLMVSVLQMYSIYYRMLLECQEKDSKLVWELLI